MENEIREKIQRMQIKAESLLQDNKRAFIKDTNDTYYFCDLLIVGETKLLFKPFKGNSFGEKVSLYWADILKIDEYKDLEVLE